MTANVRGVLFACGLGSLALIEMAGCKSAAKGQLSGSALWASVAPSAPLSADPDLAAAERAAILTLPELRAALARADAGVQNVEVEAIVQDGALSERLWFGEVRAVADGFEGSLESQPQALRSVQRGQQRRIPERDVVDWAYEERGKRLGGRTRSVAARERRDAELADALVKCDEQRFAEGCTALAESYANGSIGEVRPEAAFELFGKACASASASACNSAGWASLHGRGTPQNLPAAAQFFARACSSGDEHPFACDSRGFALLSGLAGTPRDLSLAQRLLGKACARGVPQSCLLIELAKAKHLLQGPKLERACDVTFSEQVSRCNGDQDPEACFLAGSAIETGICGVPKSAARSAALLRAAAAFGATWPSASAQPIQRFGIATHKM